MRSHGSIPVEKTEMYIAYTAALICFEGTEISSYVHAVRGDYVLKITLHCASIRGEDLAAYHEKLKAIGFYYVAKGFQSNRRGTRGGWLRQDIVLRIKKQNEKR